MINAGTGKKDGVFLATTALEEFWDTTKPMVFLGEWCLLHSRRSNWRPLNGQLVASPFDNAKTAHAAYHFVDEIYERVLPLLADALNTIHGTCYGQRYWRIVIGPWLQFYLPVIYDRYSHIKCALEQYPDCTTTVLSGRSFVVPSDTLEFVGFIKEDSFNLQIFTRILTSLGKTFPCKEAQIEQKSIYGKLGGRSWMHKAIGYLSKLYAGAGAKVFQSTILRNSYFSRAIEFQLLVKTTGKVLPIAGQLTKPITPKFDSNVRTKLSDIWLGDTEFEQCLSAMLSSDIPMCFVEAFVDVKREAQNAYPNSPKAIFSANAWYYDEHFKQWAAESAERGTLLIGTAHGGAYGGWVNFPSENHETAIVGRYYSWGWERADCVAKIIPFPASKLVGRKKINASNLKTGIVWATTTSPRYLRQFPSLPIFFHEYLSWQCRFAKALHRKIVPLVRLRPHREDGGWDIVQRLSKYIPNASIETWEVPFQKSLVNCRLYVCDHMSTTYTEALAANKPTILFWNPQTNELRPEAQPYYDLLRKNGILFDTPESAGRAVNQIYDDVETWWNDPKRQNSVEIFCERFARNSPDAIELWAAEFKKIAAMPRPKANRAG